MAFKFDGPVTIRLTAKEAKDFYDSLQFARDQSDLSEDEADPLEQVMDQMRQQATHRKQT